MEVIRARSELERRKEYMDMLVPMHATLAQLIAQALHNSPDQRPTAEDLLTALQQMKEEVDGEYGGRAIKLDMEKVKLTKEVKMKDGRIQELEQQVHMHGIQGIFSVLIHACIHIYRRSRWWEKSK